MTDAERLASLKIKRDARRNVVGFEANVRAIDEEIARIEAALPPEGEMK